MILHHIKQASILDAHEITPNAEKALILLTFLPWHLNWWYNTKNTPSRCVFSFLALRVAGDFEPRDLRRRSWVQIYYSTLFHFNLMYKNSRETNARIPTVFCLILKKRGRKIPFRGVGKYRDYGFSLAEFFC